jgi:hypothetical protein
MLKFSKINISIQKYICEGWMRSEYLRIFSFVEMKISKN